MIKNRINKTKIIQIKQTAAAIMEKKAEFDGNMESFKESVQAIKLNKAKISKIISDNKDNEPTNRVKEIAKQKMKAKVQK